MRKLDSVIIAGKNKAARMVQEHGLSKEEGGGSQILMEIGLIIVGVALLIIFNTKISEMVSSFAESAKTKLNGIWPAS